jgi:SAM-dependent methyltransferase
LVVRLPDPVRRLGRVVVDALPGTLQDKVHELRTPRDQRGLAPPSRISPTENVEYNTEIWDWYADRWNDPAFRQQQLLHEGRAGEDAGDVTRLGEEWGRLEDAVQAIDEWILPYVDPASVCGEIGTGGGRVAVRVAPKVGEFHAFDVSTKMLQLVRTELREVPGAAFHHLQAPTFAPELAGRFDFLYSFDVFVHLDLHVQWRYLQEVHRALKPGGKAFLHTANLTTEAGWKRFVEQDRYRVEGFYFMTPQAVRTLVERAGLRVLEERGGEPGNFYYERDYLVLVEKPAGAGPA